MRLSTTPGVRGAIYRGRKISYALRNIIYLARLKAQHHRRETSITQVVVGRNDDYMPDFLQRLTATIEWNKCHLVDEVVFVEWNPPACREYLAMALTRRFDFLRAYIVPPEIHSVVCQNPNLALMEYHAKNVGIRRAESSWVVATNADAAFGPDTVYQIRNVNLSHDTVWTAQRVEVKWREGRSDQIKLSDLLRYRRISPYIELGTGEFTMASRNLWHKTRGYNESLTMHRLNCDWVGVSQMIAYGAKIRKAGIVLHLAHSTSCAEGVRPHHGKYAPLDILPYKNCDDWGLGNCREVQISERVWRLESPD